MTLLAEIQQTLERTYRPSGLCLEHCVIGRERSRQLNLCLPPRDRGLSPLARTYLRWHEGSLYLALYYDPSLIETLERLDPREGISHENISELIVFIEEITHGLHAALAFQAGWKAWGSEQFACNLELQARVDTYWMLVKFCRSLQGKATDRETRNWIKARLFEDETISYADTALARRYAWARQGARDFVEFCEQGGQEERLQWIKAFRDLSLSGKIRFLRRQTGSALALAG